LILLYAKWKKAQVQFCSAFGPYPPVGLPERAGGVIFCPLLAVRSFAATNRLKKSILGIGGRVFPCERSEQNGDGKLTGHGKSVIYGTLCWNLGGGLCEERGMRMESTVANRITGHSLCVWTLAIVVGPSRTLIN
jgi:hypothetical protein